MAELNAITRKEKFLAKAAGEDVETPEPITRKEKFLAKAAGLNVETPEPITREEMFLSKITGGGGGGGGGSSVSPKDVNFYDYDGTLLHSYTVAEAQALSELPPLPTQKGLVCQGWNWTLDEIKEVHGEVDAGATYITDDGKTRLYIKIAAEGRMDVPLYFQQTKANGVTIDWGDGSATETLSGTGKVKTVHTYANTGDYVISLDVAEGCTLLLGHDSYGICVMGEYTSDSSGFGGNVYCNMLKKVEVGAGVSFYTDRAFSLCTNLEHITLPLDIKGLDRNSFQGCYSLKCVIIPRTVISVGGSTFTDCYSLTTLSLPNTLTAFGSVTDGNMLEGCCSIERVVIPDSAQALSTYGFRDCSRLVSVICSKNISAIPYYLFHSCFNLKRFKIPSGVTSIDHYAFYYCSSLESVELPNGVTSIGASAFQGCCCLTSLKIPSGVTAINTNSFRDCYSMKFYDFTSHTTVPTLSNTSAFMNIPSDCEIRVPSALYEEWKAATNWSTYADKIVAV
jgi:hypothetical protein